MNEEYYTEPPYIGEKYYIVPCVCDKPIQEFEWTESFVNHIDFGERRLYKTRKYAEKAVKRGDNSWQLNS